MTPVITTNHSERGFSLIELLFSLGLLTIIIGSVASLIQQSQVVFKNERNALGSIQDMRGAFDQLTEEISIAGTGQVSDYGIVAGAADTLTIRGNFDSISTIALTVTAGTGNLVVGSTAGFTSGQTVALSLPNGGKALWTKITGVNSTINTLTVSTSTTPITSGSTLSDFGAGTLVDVIQRVKYTISSSGVLTRTTSPELDTNSATSSTLADNVLDASGNPGLTFAYADANDAAVTLPITSSNSTAVARITITLNVRMKEKDTQTNSYRNYSLTSYVYPRS